MRDREGNIEILLLLCCLVGVVSFFCLGIAFTNALFESQGDKIKNEELIKEKEEKEALLKGLEEEREKLEEERQEKERLLFDEGKFSEAHEKKIPSSEREEIKKELNRLNEEYDRLVQEIEELRRKLAALPTTDYEGKEKREEEWKALQRELEELERKIREKETLLAASGESGTDSLEEEIAKYRIKLEEIQQKKEKLGKEIKRLKMEIITAGPSEYRNPLYVDCKKEVYVFYPGKEMVPVTELERRSLFEEKSAGHDIIVLYVRPDGFESFRKAYDKVNAMDIDLCYEPLEADENLDVLFKGVEG